MNAEQTVLKTIQERDLICSGDSLVLGLSGGPDSLCLLDVLAKLQPELNFSLYALHVNHQIRGAEADRDMLYAVKACKKLGVPVTVKTANIPVLASKWGIGEEDCGRRIRQMALAKKAEQLAGEAPGGRVKVVLAHNRDDQAETVLMRILRGTGVHGLAAMEYKREDGLIRPLLDVARSDIERYCREHELKPAEDSTNMSLEYTRNKVRLRLIPALEREFNPNLKEGLVRLADSAREDDAFINAAAAAKLPSAVEGGSSDDWCCMLKSQLAVMEPAVAKRVIKMMFARAGLKQDIAAVHIQSLLAALKSSDNLTIEFPKGYRALLSYDRVFFRAPAREPERGSKWKLFCGVIPIEELPPIKSLGKDTCALDALKVLACESDVTIRTRRPGDIIRPLGLGGSKKLQDYMTDAKIPREERDNIKLLCCRHRILWVRGFTVSDLCKVDEDTDFVLVTRIQEG